MQIEATEYVEDLFSLSSKYGTPSLSHFSELVNREMMWTISEVVAEANAAKRMRIVKQVSVDISRKKTWREIQKYWGQVISWG